MVEPFGSVGRTSSRIAWMSAAVPEVAGLDRGHDVEGVGNVVVRDHGAERLGREGRQTAE